MAKYLYGAAVQGIQGFILETNKLREITGGSEFVEQICTLKFKELLGADFKDDSLIQGAAGIIRYLFESKEACERAVLRFPFLVQTEAPGIGIVQTVLEIKGSLETEHISLLIHQLEEQRNRAQLSFLAAPMIAERSRNNGQAAVKKEGTDFLSRQQKLKQDLAHTSESLAAKIGLQKESLPTGDLEELSGKGENKDQWLAVIHADGNSLGKLIIDANTILKKSRGNVQEFYRSFSNALDEATVRAAKVATQTALRAEIEDWKNSKPENKIPIRPVLLGGDDLTLIIKAKYALAFAHTFMKVFEEASKELVYQNVLQQFGNFTDFAEGLTTCAGIAYIKPNYPFHYAEDLARQLCKEAKKVSKTINSSCAPGSLMFHQVQSSFVGKWEETIARELTVSHGSFAAGPYFLHAQTGHPTISNIQKWADALNATTEAGERHSIKAQIRALITEYIDNPAGAPQYEARLRQLNKAAFEQTGLTGKSIFSEKKVSHAWDIIKLATIEQEKTVSYE